MSIYKRLLKLYRTNMLKTPLEDFTTEIFAGLLEENKELCIDFVNNILHIEGNNFDVFTQQRYLLNDPNCPDCRVDLVIKSSDMICFIENKVESKEGYIQLDRYSRILNTYLTNYKTHLRYCTKYYDYKKREDHDFSQFRWASIYKFLKERVDIPNINDFLSFLEDNNMSENLDFDFSDLIAMQQMTQVIKIMDNYLDKLKPIFANTLGQRLKDTSPLRQIKEHSRYILLKDNPFGNSGYCELGFGFGFEDVPQLKIWIWVSDKNDKAITFKEAIKDGYSNLETNHENWIGLYKPISDFLSSENMEFDIEEWFVTSFNKFKAFSDATPELNWNLN